jgi:putative nucleotidyltransferase with HDIG domain
VPVPRVRTNRSRQARRAIRCHEDGSASWADFGISPEKAALAAHGHDVAQIAARIAKELGLSAERIDHLRFAGLFHDIGKLWVPDRILEKDGPLTVAEWVEVRKHPESGALMLRAYGLDQEAEWVLYHHERPDGLGYPYGLSGDEIPLESRILAIADAWSAMRADRAYSAPLPRENARSELEYTKGEQFDHALVGVFLDLVEPQLDATPSPGTIPSS